MYIEANHSYLKKSKINRSGIRFNSNLRHARHLLLAVIAGDSFFVHRPQNDPQWKLLTAIDQREIWSLAKTGHIMASFEFISNPPKYQEIKVKS